MTWQRSGNSEDKFPIHIYQSNHLSHVFKGIWLYLEVLNSILLGLCLRAFYELVSFGNFFLGSSCRNKLFKNTKSLYLRLLALPASKAPEALAAVKCWRIFIITSLLVYIDECRFWWQVELSKSSADATC